MIDGIARERSRTIEGFFDCGAILTSTDSLDRSYPVSIENQPCSVTFPRLDVQAHPDRIPSVIAPSWEHPSATVPESTSNDGEESDWGRVTQTSTAKDGSKTPIAVLVSGLRISAQVEPIDATRRRIAQTMNNAIADWWALACSWFAVLTQVDPQPVATRRPDGIGAPLYMWTSDDGTTRTPVQVSSSGTLTFPGRVTLLEPDTIQRSFDRASKGIDCPLEWLLVRDARSLLNAGEYRRAVIDAGTAAELAITRLLDDKLAGTPTEIREALLAKYRMLGQSSQLLRKLGHELPQGFQQQLIEPRNAAAHSGLAPKRTEAKAAVLASAEIVEQAIPLQSL